MSTQPTEPIVLPADTPKPRKGERAAQIRSLAVRYPELSHSDIAKTVGCDPSNVPRVLNTFLGTKSLDNLEEFRADKTQIFEALQYRALSSITDESLAKANPLQLITGAAILQDKIQLMSGLPTSIHVTALLDIADMLRKREGG